MGTFEVRGGPLTHRYLMNKTKDDLARMVLDYAQVVGRLEDRVEALEAQYNEEDEHDDK